MLASYFYYIKYDVISSWNKYVVALYKRIATMQHPALSSPNKKKCVCHSETIINQ